MGGELVDFIATSLCFRDKIAQPEEHREKISGDVLGFLRELLSEKSISVVIPRIPFLTDTAIINYQLIIHLIERSGVSDMRGARDRPIIIEYRRLSSLRKLLITVSNGRCKYERGFTTINKARGSLQFYVSASRRAVRH